MPTFTEDGESSVYFCNGPFTISGIGNFGAGTIAFKRLTESGYQTIPGMTYTEDFHPTVYNYGQIKVKMVLTGATSPDIDYDIGGQYVVVVDNP